MPVSYTQSHRAWAPYHAVPATSSAWRCFSELVLCLLQYLPVSVLRSYPGLLPQLTHCLFSLPVLLPLTSLSVCGRIILTVGNSDHYTTLLKIPQDVTKLLITARSSFQGCLSASFDPSAPYLPSTTATHTSSSYSATSHACLTPSPGAVSSAVSPPLIFSFRLC